MADAVLRSGSPEVIDYTPSSGDLAAGDVIELTSNGSNTVEVGIGCGIAMTDIANNTKGALAVRGGVWDVVNLNNAADYALVYWNGTNKVTTVSTNNARFGAIVSGGGGGANTTCQVLFDGFNVYNGT